LRGLLEGTAEPVYGAEEYVGGEMGGGKWMRQGDLKAVFVPPPYGPNEWQLFDVVEDPCQANDAAAQAAKIHGCR
jgi:arylsulfatase